MKLQQFFSAKCPSDALILLINDIVSEAGFEITIGGWNNTRSVIKSQKQGDNEEDTYKVHF